MCTGVWILCHKKEDFLPFSKIYFNRDVQYIVIYAYIDTLYVCVFKVG